MRRRNSRSTFHCTDGSVLTTSRMAMPLAPRLWMPHTSGISINSSPPHSGSSHISLATRWMTPSAKRRSVS